jgi:hypothetical protein
LRESERLLGNGVVLLRLVSCGRSSGKESPSLS